MEDIDEELKINIHSILPSISEETVNGVIHAVKYAGLETITDLQFVQEEDLILVLRPVQRRKLIKAWCEQSIPPVKSSNLPSKYVNWKRKKCLALLQVYAKYKAELSCSSLEEKHEVWKKIAEEVRQRCSLKCSELQCKDKIKELKGRYYSLKRNPENVLKQKTADFFDEARYAFETSKDSVISPVIASRKLSKICNWKTKRVIYLLRRFTKYKPILSHSDVEDQAIWKKIAHDSDVSLSRNKLDELRCEYERIKNENVANRGAAMFLDEAKRAFDTTETTEQSRGILLSLKKSNKGFVRELLQVYAKYKTEHASPDTEEQNVWEKIAREMRETFSYHCGERICRFEVCQLKCQYEDFKRGGVVSNGNMPLLFEEAKEAFEDSEKLDGTFTIKVSNLSENVEKSDLEELFEYFGRIAHIYNVKNSSGQSKGFAFIKFHKEEDATRAIKIVNGHEYDKLILKVEWAKPSQTNEVLE